MYLYLKDISLWSLLIHQHFIFTPGDTILEITNTKYLKTEKNNKPVQYFLFFGILLFLDNKNPKNDR